MTLTSGSVRRAGPKVLLTAGMALTACCLLPTRFVPPASAYSGVTPKLDLRLGHNAQLIAFSPGSSEAATASHDGTIILWNLRSSEIIQTIHLPNHENARSLCFSFDGSTLASAANNLDNRDGVTLSSSHACLWDAATGKLIRTLNDKTWAMGLACSPTKDLVAVREESMTSLAQEPGSVIQIYAGHTGALVSRIPLENHLIDAMTFSKDGSLFAVVDARPDPSSSRRSGVHPSTIILWSADASAEIGRIEVKNGPVFAVRFAPVEHTIAAIAGDGDKTGQIDLWDTRTLDLVRTLAIKDTVIENFAFSPDGRRIAACHIGSQGRNDRFVVIWDVNGNQQLKRIPTQSITSSVCFNGDGSRLYTSVASKTSMAGRNGWGYGVPGGIALWNSSTGELLRTTGDRDAGMSYFALSPDGSGLLATGAGVRFFDAQTLRLKSYALPAPHVPMTLRLSPDGRRLAVIGNVNARCTVLDLATGRLTPSFGANRDYISDAAFAPNNAAVWMLGMTYKPGAPPGLPVLLGVIEGFDLAGNRIRRAVMPTPPNPAPEGGIPFSSVLFSPTEKDLLIVGGGAGEPKEDGRDRAALAAAGLLRANWVRDDMSGPQDNAVDGITWWRNGEPIKRYVNAVTGSVYGLAVSPDGKTLASGSQYETLFWNAQTGAQIARFHTRYFGGAPALGYINAAIRPMEFSPDGSVLATGDFCAVRLYGNTGGRWHELVTLPEQTEPAEARRVQRYSGGSEVLALPEQREPVRDLAFSPDGRLLATAGQDGAVHIWDMNTGRGRVLLAHDEPVRSVLWRGRALITGCQDGRVRFWKAATGELELTLVMFPNALNSNKPTWIAYTPAGLYDSSGDVGGILRWRVDSHTYPARTFRNMMHRPNLIARTLGEL